MTSPLFYISITGIVPKGVGGFIGFWWHSLRTMRQAKAAAGLLAFHLKKKEGVFMTLTVWQSHNAMRAFMLSGAHKQAMRSFRSFYLAKTMGYEAEAIPSWDHAYALWYKKGKEYRSS